MSNIYEALQRAEDERRNNSAGEQLPPVNPYATSSISEFAGAEDLLDFSKCSPFAWQPAEQSLPTLSERGQCVEQFRALRSHLYLQRLEGTLKSILISSGTPGEGKSFVAANLAVSLASSNDRRVLLIDGDLRKPTLHKLLGAPSGPGLAEYLEGNAGLTEIMQVPQQRSKSSGLNQKLPNLTFIGAGASPDTSLEIAGNHRVEELVGRLRAHFDWILLDSPPVLAVADAVDLAHAADGVLLVARAGVTPYDVAQKTQLAFSNSKVIGYVLNAAKEAAQGNPYYYYYGAKLGEKDSRQAGKSTGGK